LWIRYSRWPLSSDHNLYFKKVSSSPNYKHNSMSCKISSSMKKIRELPCVIFYICIFFSETNGPIGTKLSRNVHWMVPYKVYDFLLIRSTQKKQEAQKCLKGCIHKEQLFVSNKTKVIHQKTIFFTFCTYLRGITPTVKGIMVKMEHDLYLVYFQNCVR
jgi:hypothetical protein